MFIACLAIMLTYLPIAGLSAALGSVAHASHASATELQWTTDVYVLAMAATVLIAGTLGERFGRHAILNVGLGLLGAGSIASAAAAIVAPPLTFTVFWCGEAIAGIGGGALLASTLALAGAAATDRHTRSRNISFWAAALVVGTGVGPFVFAAVVTTTAWQLMMLPTGLAALITLPFAARFVTSAPGRTAGGIDIPGQVLGALSVLALSFGVIEGGSEGWGSMTTILSLVIAAAALTLFIIVERRSPAPAVQLSMFTKPEFSLAAAAALVVLFSIVGTSFVLSLFFSTVQHLSAFPIAERTLFLSLTAAIAGPIAGRLQRTLPPLALLTAGLIIAAAGVLALLTLHHDSSYTATIWPLALAGIGNGTVLSTGSTVAIHAVPHELAGMAGATNTLFRQIGAALGPSVLGTIVASTLAHGHTLNDAVQLSAIVIGAALVVAAVLTGAIAVRVHRAPTPVAA
ncbi:hypothetical protein NS330_03115 [Curtobacterium citreum]|nr:hypothetical protein NS330_03115 [Curtobacterium citreum]